MSINKRDQIKMVQNYISFTGKVNVILLGTLDSFFGDTLSTNEKIVFQVLDEDPIPIKEISLRTGLLLTTLTNIIDKMESKRLVKRIPSRTDRRVINIELAVASHQIKTRYDRLMKQIATVFLGFLSDEDRTDFTDILGRIVDLLTAESDDVQESFGALNEPLKSILAGQFKKEN